MLELQKIFLLVRFLNRISCNKGLKAKILGFFTCFFCLTPLGLECSRSRKTALFLMSHRLKNYKNLHPRSFTNGAKTWYRKTGWLCSIFKHFIPYFKKNSMLTANLGCNLTIRLWGIVTSKNWPTDQKPGPLGSTKAPNKVTPWKQGALFGVLPPHCIGSF